MHHRCGALSVLCAQLTRDLLVIAKFLSFTAHRPNAVVGLHRVRKSTPLEF